MPHKIDMVMDFQYGSTGKGLIAGYLAKRNEYDTAVCAFSTNAGHVYRDRSRNDMYVMTQQLPTAITSPHVKNILIGPGAAIHLDTLCHELYQYSDFIKDKRILIHPQAAIVTDDHAHFEKLDGRTKMGSTAKGVGEAYIQRMRRSTDSSNTFGNRGFWTKHNEAHVIDNMVVTETEYCAVLEHSESLLIEGCQGFSLSMYHGQYPYTTSRDVTPWQIAADCGIPFKMAPYIQVIGTLRTFPIRVNNRDGSSGPHYRDQTELDWKTLGMEPELTTVTKLPRRVFTFSQSQLDDALFHCGGYWETKIFLNFANYLKSRSAVHKLITEIETASPRRLNPAKVAWVGEGPDDSDVIERKKYVQY